jgi:hypothetical protein
VSFLAAGVGIFWLIFDPKRQGWHDKIANTYVVDNPYSGGPQFMKDFFKIGERKQEGKPDPDEDDADDSEAESSAPDDEKSS